MYKILKSILILLCYGLTLIYGQPFDRHIIDSQLAGARCLTVADLDGDTKLDIIAVGYLENKLVWYKNYWKKPYDEEDMNLSHFKPKFVRQTIWSQGMKEMLREVLMIMAKSSGISTKICSG